MIRIPSLLLAVAAVAVLGAAGPAAAQYSGTEVGLVLDETIIPEGDPVSGNGFGCAAGVTVTISIVGVGVITTVVAADDGTYEFTDIPLPPGLVVGDDYEVAASCPGSSPPTPQIFTLVCSDGSFPDADGNCVGVIQSTTTTTPGSSTTTTAAPTTTADGGSTQQGPPLAVTGSSLTTLLVQVAASLVGVGALFAVLGRRRDAEPDVVT